jgi:hypothetical protein
LHQLYDLVLTTTQSREELERSWKLFPMKRKEKLQEGKEEGERIEAGII